MTQRAEMLTKPIRHQLHDDLAELAKRYVEHHGSDLDGMAALGEDLDGRAVDPHVQGHR